MKQLKDYLHLYLGAECKARYPGYMDEWMNRRVSARLIEDYHFGRVEVQLYLRPLHNMTTEEKETFNGMKKWDGFHYLLSRHFDLFNLIQLGLARDATTLIATDTGKDLAQWLKEDGVPATKTILAELREINRKREAGESNDPV